MKFRPFLAGVAALALGAAASAATAPKFSDPEVTACCQAFSDFVDECAVVIKAAMELESTNPSAAQQKEAVKSAWDAAGGMARRCQATALRRAGSVAPLPR